jgi:glycosyltransferase involved in cell wall biosynthesis
MYKEKINVLFILPSLRPGGAERVVSTVAKTIDRKKFNPVLLVIGFEKDKAYSVDNLEVVYLNKTRVIKAVYALFKYIWQSKPDIVMSSISHVNILMGIFSLFFSKPKFVAREASVASSMQKFRSRKILIPRWIIKYLYTQFETVICQSRDMAIDIQKLHDLPSDTIVIINNPISSTLQVRDESVLESNLINFITVGRLSNEKGHLRILQLLSEFSKPFHYTIIGDGPEKSVILNFVKEIGIQERITHIPFTNDVRKYLVKNDIFLQGSYVEGFPNALLESCKTGTPVLAFDAPGGTKEIIEPGVNGFIVKNENEFHSKLEQLLAHNWEPKIISNSVTKKFSEEKIISEYEKLFVNVLYSKS